MIEAIAEIAVWFAFWNLGETAEEDSRVPVWKRVLLSVDVLTVAFRSNERDIHKNHDELRRVRIL